MSELDVRIVKLEPMRVASALGFGEHPEGLAWDKILGWAKPLGLLNDQTTRFFGFNNPDPSPGSPNYGYEQWIIVGPDIKGEGDVKIKDFAGGLYAVTSCKLENIGETWRQLVVWRDSSKYRCASHQWLEEVLNREDILTPDGRKLPDETVFDKMILDLYLPIAE
jgi:DNA gyrase inhibitor GyrI